MTPGGCEDKDCRIAQSLFVPAFALKPCGSSRPATRRLMHALMLGYAHNKAAEMQSALAVTIALASHSLSSCKGDSLSPHLFSVSASAKQRPRVSIALVTLKLGMTGALVFSRNRTTLISTGSVTHTHGPVGPRTCSTCRRLDRLISWAIQHHHAELQASGWIQN